MSASIRQAVARLPARTAPGNGAGAATGKPPRHRHRRDREGRATVAFGDTGSDGSEDDGRPLESRQCSHAMASSPMRRPVIARCLIRMHLQLIVTPYGFELAGVVGCGR